MRLLVLASVVLAEENVMWGADMHRVTAYIAQSLLTSTAQSAVKNLLPEVNGDLPSIATWADDVRSQRPWSAPLHFADVPGWNCTYIASRDCPTAGCVDSAVQNYTHRLADRNLPMTERAEALKFLVHFIGDLHQPLHVGFKEDLGGNNIRGTFFGTSTNLHAVWDTGLPVHQITSKFGGKWEGFGDDLKTRLSSQWGGEVAKWRECATNQNPWKACSAEWTSVSAELACRNGYVRADGTTHIVTGFVETDAYFNRNLPIVEMRVAQAGVRMASVLNNILV